MSPAPDVHGMRPIFRVDKSAFPPKYTLGVEDQSFNRSHEDRRHEILVEEGLDNWYALDILIALFVDKGFLGIKDSGIEQIYAVLSDPKDLPLDDEHPVNKDIPLFAVRDPIEYPEDRCEMRKVLLHFSIKEKLRQYAQALNSKKTTLDTLNEIKNDLEWLLTQHGFNVESLSDEKRQDEVIQQGESQPFKSYLSQAAELLLKTQRQIESAEQEESIIEIPDHTDHLKVDLIREPEKQLSTFEHAADILLGDKHGDDIDRIKKQLKSAFNGLAEISKNPEFSRNYKKFCHDPNSYAIDSNKENFQKLNNALNALRELGDACNALTQCEETSKNVWVRALKRLIRVTADILTGSGKTSLTLEAWRLKNIADWHDPSKTTLGHAGNALLLALVYLSKLLVDTIVLIKANFKDTPVTHRTRTVGEVEHGIIPEKPEYTKQGTWSKKPKR